MKIWLKLLILVAVLGVVFVLLDGRPVKVTDFHSCVNAGYPVAESFPRQCTGPDGQTFTEEVSEEPEVVVETPTRGALAASPLNIKGKARGTWFFEANLPVTLKDQNGKILAQKGFQAKGEWMTEDYVEFEDSLTFSAPTTEFGVLVIENDNPSGLPENEKSFAVPVRFR
ncbi:MAG: hypothetical protein HY395_02295 [Candidatus Doudnabacteria bacterium]|nr:hypothetical protein [Candidatus Doudnabacteria bacterium]